MDLYRRYALDTKRDGLTDRWTDVQCNYYMYYCILGKITVVDSFLASRGFCRLLQTFANNMDPDKHQQNVRPEYGFKPFETLIVFMK